jgi:hypothetical protein
VRYQSEEYQSQKKKGYVHLGGWAKKKRDGRNTRLSPICVAIAKYLRQGTLYRKEAYLAHSFGG